MPANKTKTVRSAKRENRSLKVKTSLRAGGELPTNVTINPNKQPVNTVNT
jgi:hypothetical protein